MRKIRIRVNLFRLLLSLYIIVMIVLLISLKKATNVEKSSTVDNDTSIEENVLEYGTTSLTLEDIHTLDMPLGYYVQIEENYELKNQDNYLYTDDNNETLLVPQLSTIDSEVLVSSGLEGDMGDFKIYTLADIVTTSGETGTILYVNDPNTLQFVACNVTIGDISWLYQFIY